MSDNTDINTVNEPENTVGDIEMETEKETEKEPQLKTEETAAKKDGKEKKLKAKLASLEKENEKLKNENEELNDNYLRVAAEYDNFRRRSQKEKEGIYSDALSDSVKELLPLFDNLERASSFTESDKLAEGLEMILKTIPDVLAKLKVECYGQKGDSFDPNLHNAIMHEENEEYGENEIVEVFQKGYKVNEKIIRHAMVKVAN